MTTSRRYSVICHSKPKPGVSKETVVATGLPLEQARATANRLDQAYRDGVEAAGKRYSAWTADLHCIQLEKDGQ